MTHSAPQDKINLDTSLSFLKDFKWVRVEKVNDDKILRLMMPITGSYEGISTDNTCKTTLALKSFMGNSLETTKSAEEELNLFKEKVGKIIESLKILDANNAQIKTLEGYLGDADRLLHDFSQFKLSNPNLIDSTEIPVKIQEFIFAEKKPNRTAVDEQRLGGIGQSNFYAVHLRPRAPDPILGIKDPVAGTDNAKEGYLKADFRFNRDQASGSTSDVNYWQIQLDGFVKKLMQEFIGDGAHNQRLAVAKKTKEIKAGELNEQFGALIEQAVDDKNLNPIFLNSLDQQSDDLKLSKLYSDNTNIKEIFGIDLEDGRRSDIQKQNLELFLTALKEFFKQKFGIAEGDFDIRGLESVISVNKDNIADISELVTFVFNDVQALCQGQESDENISPFFSINIESTDENNDGRNKLAIISQFFIAKFNQFCVMNGYCDRNIDLGTFLDKTPSASEDLVKIIKTNLQAGSDEIEERIIKFLSSLKNLNDKNLISKALSSADSQKLKAEFKLNWQTVQDSDHFDDFMFVSPKDQGRIIYSSGNMLFDFSSFYAFQYGKEAPRYKPQSFCLSKVAGDQEDQERFKDDYYVAVAKQGLIDRIKELLKLPNKDNISEVIVYLLQETTGVDRNHSFLFKTQGFELESLIPDSADKEQIKKFLKLIAKKNLKDQVFLKDFLKYINPNHQEELKFTQQDLRALYVAISARDYGKKNLTVNDIKGYQTPEDIAKIINIALAMRDKEAEYKINFDIETQKAMMGFFEGVKLDDSLRKIDSTKISVDKAGNAYLAITKDQSAEFKTQLDPLKDKFKKIFYLYGGQVDPDQDTLVTKLFERANSGLGNRDWSEDAQLRIHYRNQGIAVNNDNVQQYRVRRALEILRVDMGGAIGRVSYAGNFGYRVELEEGAYLSLEQKLFTKKISSQQAVKIYQLVRYLCPEETYNEMMRLNNLGWGVPKKFEFALQALGVNFSQLYCDGTNGFKAVIDQDFLDFVDQIPTLRNQHLSLSDTRNIYNAFNKKFAGNQQILSQLGRLSNYPNPDKIKFALDKLGIPYFDAKSRDDEDGINIDIIPGLVKDLKAYLGSSNASELELQCYKDPIKSSNFSSKILGLDERVLLGELNLARLNLDHKTQSPVKFEPPKPQIKIQRVQAYRKTSSQLAVVNENQAKVICPESVLTEFRELMSQTQVLGTEIFDPYSQTTIKIPEKPQDLQPWHLQLLARNEYQNVTGLFDFSLYKGLMTDDQVVRLRCLVKATTLVGIDEVTKTGGYPYGSPTQIAGGAKKIIVIDQSGLQWQYDHRNTGGMFFYPTDDSNNTQSISGGYESFKKFQKDMYQAMYGRVRDQNAPSKQEDYIETNWLGVGGKLDLRGVSLGIKEEFLQALNSAISSSDFVDENEKILFRFLKAGMGFFRSGLKEINGNNSSLSGQNSLKLENARIQGILDALKELDKVLPQDLELRKKFFKKVSALQLPFSRNETSPSLDQSQQGLKPELAKEVNLLSEIKNLATKLGIEYKGDNKIDACQPVDGYVVATTNTGDPHALMGNEGGYHSVDAAISSNLVNPAKFQHLFDNFIQHDRNILVQRSGQKSQSQRVAIVGEVPTMPAPAALTNVAQQPQVLTPVLEFHGIEYTSAKYNYRPNSTEDNEYKTFSGKIVNALVESYNEALRINNQQDLNQQVKEKLLIAIMQIADKNQGIGNCNPQAIKNQIKHLMDIGDDDTGGLETYYKIAVNFSANFQRQAIAKTGNTSSSAKLETNLRLFRVCTQQNIQHVCLELFDKDNKPAELAVAGAGADLEQERIKKHNRNKKIISLVSNLQKNSDKLENTPLLSPEKPRSQSLIKVMGGNKK